MEINENMIRLQKYLAMCGVASRRQAEKYIADGLVSVNGKVIKEQGVKISEHDIVEFKGKVIRVEEKKVYILLNKPEGYVTTVKEQFSRKTVIDLVGDIGYRIYPVGRLDYNTSGLILLTNDGEFTNFFTHPSHEIEKVYIAKIRGRMDKDKIERFKNGIILDGKMTAPADIKIIDIERGHCKAQVTIHEGRNRQVRRMFESLDTEVLDLMRIQVGPIKLGSLPLGKWRYLSEDEVKEIMQ